MLRNANIEVVQAWAIFEFGCGFLRKYVYFRVISIHFNPYCMYAHCMIYDRFAAHSHGNYCSYLQAF